MKLHKNFIRLGMALLLGCMTGSTVFAGFGPSIKIQNASSRPVINVEFLDALNNRLQSFGITPAMGKKEYPIGGAAEKIKISVDGFSTTLSGLPTSEPDLIFRKNDDNFATTELQDNDFRYPITSQCAPIINSKQMLSAPRPIWPSGGVLPVVNKTPLPVVITQRNSAGGQLGAPLELWTIGSSGSLKIQAGLHHIEINVGYINFINIFSFKYNNAHLSFEPAPKGVIMKDGHYTYFVMHPFAPIIKGPSGLSGPVFHATSK